MSWKILVISILVTLAAVGTSAEVEVTIGDEPLELGGGSAPALEPPNRDPSQPEGGVTSLMRAHQPTIYYIFPHFRVDTQNAFGDTTLLAVRNESSGSNLVTIEIYDAAGGNKSTVAMSLVPKEVWTLNLRDATSSIPVDGDGYRRGSWGYVSGSSGEVSVDWFQVNPDEDFAVGGTGVNTLSPDRDVCSLWKIRSLLGGGFSGGTTITLMLGMSCTVSGNVYTEAGSFANSFSFPTGNRVSLTVNAADLTTTNFSSMDIDLSQCPEGWVGVVHDAEGRYSVGVDGICTD